MPLEILLSIAAAITATGVIIGGIVQVYRLVHKVSSAIGVDKNGRTLSERLDRVEHQLWENGGSSLADRVNSIEATSIKTSAEVELIKDLIMTNTAATPVVRKIRKKAS